MRLTKLLTRLKMVDKPQVLCKRGTKVVYGEDVTVAVDFCNDDEYTIFHCDECGDVVVNWKGDVVNKRLCKYEQCKS
jgi:hypothetical protein